jgi:DNA-binding transcriptional MerR regulator
MKLKAEIEKRYYFMGEAAKTLGEPESTLRYWSDFFGLCVRGESEKKKPVKFTKEEMEVFRFVQKKSKEGFSLGLIKSFRDNRIKSINKLKETIKEIEEINLR